MKENTKMDKKKMQLIKDWEECFKMKVSDKLTAEGLKKFWSDDTSVEEAAELLTAAAVDDLLDSLIGRLLGGSVGVMVVHVGGNDEEEDKQDEEPCNVKNGTPFKVARLDEGGKIIQLYDDEFETEEAARAYIKEIVNYSSCTLSDFAVTKVQVL